MGNKIKELLKILGEALWLMFIFTIATVGSCVAVEVFPIGVAVFFIIVIIVLSYLIIDATCF